MGARADPPGVWTRGSGRPGGGPPWRMKVDEHYRTSAEHIDAVGDVIGFPALAATSMDQGRLAAQHAYR